jgi:hypothetical protein
MYSGHGDDSDSDNDHVYVASRVGFFTWSDCRKIFLGKDEGQHERTSASVFTDNNKVSYSLLLSISMMIVLHELTYW